MRKIITSVFVLFFVTSLFSCRANKEIPRFVPDDNADDLPAYIQPDRDLYDNQR